MVYSKCRIRVISPPQISQVVVVAVVVVVIQLEAILGTSRMLEFKLNLIQPQPLIRFTEVPLIIKKFKGEREVCDSLSFPS